MTLNYEQQEELARRCLRVFHQHPADPKVKHQKGVTYFYFLDTAEMVPYTTLGILDAHHGAVAGIQQDWPRQISQMFTFEVDSIPHNQPLEKKVTVLSRPSGINTTEIRQLRTRVDSYRQMYGLFADHYEGLQTFQEELSQRDRTKSLAQWFSRDLELLKPHFTEGARALLGAQSAHPVHDFLMIVDSLYRRDREEEQRLGLSFRGADY